MAFYVFVHEGMIIEDNEFDKKLSRIMQFPQPDAHGAWNLWADLCTGFHQDPHWQRNENWTHVNGVRRFWKRDTPSITVEIKVKEIP